MTFDVIVIGGGPAGVSAALRARELGATVALVEATRLGGTCTNDGCVPTRVLARASRLAREAKQFARYGLICQAEPKVDFAHLITVTRELVEQVHDKKRLDAHLQNAGVGLFVGNGPAKLVAQADGRHVVALADGKTLSARGVVLCAGGRPRRPSFPGHELAIAATEVWHADRLPASVAIIGASATGCQLASTLSCLGSEAHLLERAPRVLPASDLSVSHGLANAFRHRGISVLTDINQITKLERPEDPTGRLALSVQRHGDTSTLHVEAVVICMGWRGNGDRLGLEALGVEVSADGFVAVDEHLQTAVPGIFAAGDVDGGSMLVQAASREGALAAENAVLGLRRRVERRITPYGGFTDPEHASVGLTEEQAHSKADVICATVPYADLDRALIDHQEEGFFKLIADRANGQVLGAHAVGEQALEVVQAVATAMVGELTVQQLAELELAYPTYTAIVGLAARQLVRELGLVAVSPQWRSLLHARPAEWERRSR